MKKILYLSQLYPYPPDSGGKIKTLNTLRALARRYKIFAVFISEEKPNQQGVAELTGLGIGVKVFYSSKVLASVKDDLWGLVWHFVRGVPHYVFQYTHRPAFSYIHRTIEAFQPDVIHVDHLNMAQYLPKEKNQIWILEHHNVETYLYWTRFVHTKKVTRRLYLLIEMVLTYFFEHRMLPRFDHIFAISDPETARMRKIVGVPNASTQPLVYPPRPVRQRPHPRPTILFVGTLGWPPNEDAIEWFLYRMFPLITEVIPGVEFHVVGRLNKALQCRLPRIHNVFFHGYQKDITAFLARADTCVLPFRMGGGLRLKSLTALSAGVPIVSTPLGVEGLSVRHGQECLIAADPKELAGETVRLLLSASLRNRLRRNGLRYVSRYHGAEQNNDFLRHYHTILQ